MICNSPRLQLSISEGVAFLMWYGLGAELDMSSKDCINSLPCFKLKYQDQLYGTIILSYIKLRKQLNMDTTWLSCININLRRQLPKYLFEAIFLHKLKTCLTMWMDTLYHYSTEILLYYWNFIHLKFDLESLIDYECCSENQQRKQRSSSYSVGGALNKS